MFQESGWMKVVGYFQCMLLSNLAGMALSRPNLSKAPVGSLKCLGDLVPKYQSHHQLSPSLQILELPRHEDAGVKIVGNGLLPVNGIVLRIVITDIIIMNSAEEY